MIVIKSYFVDKISWGILMKNTVMKLAMLTMILLLSACGNHVKETTNKETSSSDRSSSVEKSQKLKASQVSKSSRQTTASKPQKVEISNTKMALDQISEGDYSSLLGQWHLEAAKARNTDITSTTLSELNITKTSITNEQITLNKVGIKDNQGVQPVEYENQAGKALEIQTNNQSSNTVWAVKFYPAGTTNEFAANNGAMNTKNTIVIWTSNNSMTEVYVEDKAVASDSLNKEASDNGSLWNDDKNQALEALMKQFGVTMNQDYTKYNGSNDLKTSTGTVYPSGLSAVTVDGQKTSIGWRSDGRGSNNYNVVAIYNHNGTVPPLPNHITYFFAFKNGQPIVLVDQSRDGVPNLAETRNDQLKAGFESIAKNND